ncbi:hypothetical protein WDZ17_13235, partial [Pseudokineococcus basanitobsidens]
MSCRVTPGGTGRRPLPAAGRAPTADLVTRVAGVLGELALVRRDDGVLQLRVGGVLVMESDDDASEALLAVRGLPPGRGPLHVLVGGLGLGGTAARVLEDRRVHELVVVEVEPQLVGWAREGLLPVAARVLEDPRTRVVVGDVRHELARRARARPAALDAVLLDVDNGPDQLVTASNAALYREEALADAAACVRPGGRVVVWSAVGGEEGGREGGKEGGGG